MIHQSATTVKRFKKRIGGSKPLVTVSTDSLFNEDVDEEGIPGSISIHVWKIRLRDEKTMVQD